MRLEEFTAITKALSDPHRVRALMALRRGEVCVCQLIELLSLAPSTVSKHMAILKSAGLVVSRKDSRWVHYRLAESDNGKETQRIIELAVALLHDDNDMIADTKKMDTIIDEGLDALVKKQKCS